MSESSRVLVIGREPEATEDLEHVLAHQGYSVRAARECEAILPSLDEWRPHLVFTGGQMSSAAAVALCRRIRSVSTVPLIVVSDAVPEAAKVEALDSGADDIVTRTCGAAELMARARAVLRRASPDGHEPPLVVGDFLIDFATRRVNVTGREVRLTPKEFDLLVYLARNPSRVMEHRRLLSAVWGEQAEDHPEYLRVFIGQLRKKIEPDSARPRYLVTEAWVGYRLNPTG